MFQVLVVDDDKLARKGLISIVNWEECGLEVVGDVSNGLLALQFLESNMVDLVIVDISMPVMSGIDFMTEAHRLYPKLKFVVLSFHESFDYVQATLRLGALDYISKLRIEESSCTEEFKRIGKQLELLLEKETETVQEPLSEKVLDQLMQEWCAHFFWIYQNELFQEMAEQLKNLNPDLHSLERLLIRIAQKVENEFEYIIRVPIFMNINEGIEWLTQFRQNIHEKAHQLNDSTNIGMILLNATQYIHEHLNEKITAEEVAKTVGMSRGYFSSCFSTWTGTTFQQYLRCERMERAKQIIHAGEKDSSTVAYAVGYEDYKYFHRMFLNHVGVTCHEYIRQTSTKNDLG